MCRPGSEDPHQNEGNFSYFYLIIYSPDPYLITYYKISLHFYMEKILNVSACKGSDKKVYA